MQEAGGSFLSGWETFYLIIGAAAATLMELMFVVITLAAGARLQASSARTAVSAFSSPTVVHFGTALLVAALLSVPWKALWNAGLLLGLTGVGEMAYLVIVGHRLRSQTETQPTWSDWLWYLVVPLISYISLVVAAILLPSAPAQALFILGAVTLLLLFNGIRNAWSVETYVAIERSHPENERQEWR